MRLSGKRIAALVDNGFEQVELTEPKKALEKEGARVDVVSPQAGVVKGWQHKDWGDEIGVDRELSTASADEYDGLLLPGGVMNPDHLRIIRWPCDSCSTSWTRASRLPPSATGRGRSSKRAV